ncbi:MAG: efflux RND transporter periplasmic adaptor subunit [Heliomarina sp.]|uniref:efflux RND transporter periplasmic adaptor subunit n=1 Tax=Heliomarina sp. TaxID=2917556 RepID=UPI00405A10DB
MKRAASVLVSLAMLACPLPAWADEQPLYTGYVEALNRVDVSAQIEGVVTEIHFEPGETVAEGVLLFTFDKAEFSQRLRAARAVAQKAEAILEDAENEHDRNLILKERGNVSDTRYFKSKVALSVASAAATEANSRLEAAQIDMRRTEVHAPISGIISKPFVSRGSFVETGRKGVLATIVQLDPVRIAYEIPYPERLLELGVTDLSSIDSYADTVDLVVQLAPGWDHPALAEPTHLSADVSRETRSLTAWAIVANPTHTLRPGMQVFLRPLGPEATRPETIANE